MSKNQSVKINYIYSLVAQILSVIAPVLTTPYVSRILGPDGIGIYSFSNSIEVYFTMIGVLGLGSYGQLAVAKVKDSKESRSKLFFDLYAARIILHTFCIVAYIIFLTFVSKNKIIYAIQGILLLASMFDVTWFFQGIEEFKDIAVKNIVIKIITIISIFIFVRNKGSLAVYALINCLSTFISYVCFIPKLRNFVQYVKPTTSEILFHIKQGFLYFIPTVGSVIVSTLDKTMVGLISKSDTETGYYSQAYKIVNMCTMIFTSLNLVMRSRMSFLSVNGGKNKINSMLISSLRFVSLASIPMTFGLVSIAELFVPSFFGEEYRPAITLFKTMVWWIIFSASSGCILEQYVTPIMGVNKASLVIWISAIVDFIMNLLLIGKYKALGAVVASLLTEIVSYIICMCIAKEVINIRAYFGMIWKYLLSSVVMYFILRLIVFNFEETLLNVFILMIIGSVIYFIIVLILHDEFALSITKSCINRLKISKKDKL